MPFDAEHYTPTLPDVPVAPKAHPRHNTQNIQRLRAFFTSLEPARFRIETLGGYRTCGTVACVAGWASVLAGFQEEGQGIVGTSQAAREWMGLNVHEAQDLFLPDGWNERPQTYTLPRAIRVLDILIAEGVVDWPRAIREVAA